MKMTFAPTLFATVIAVLFSFSSQAQTPDFKTAYEQAKGGYSEFLGLWKLTKLTSKTKPAQNLAAPNITAHFGEFGSNRTVYLVNPEFPNGILLETQSPDSVTQKIVQNKNAWNCRVHSQQKILLCQILTSTNENLQYVFVRVTQGNELISRPKTQNTAVVPQKPRRPAPPYLTGTQKAEQDFFDIEKTWYANHQLNVSVDVQNLNPIAKFDVVILACDSWIGDWDKLEDYCDTLHEIENFRKRQTIPLDTKDLIKKLATRPQLMVQALSLEKGEWIIAGEILFDIQISAREGAVMGSTKQKYVQLDIQSVKLPIQPTLKALIEFQPGVKLVPNENLRQTMKQAAKDPVTVVNTMSQVPELAKALQSIACGEGTLRDHVMRVLSILPNSTQCHIPDTLKSSLKAQDIDLDSMMQVVMVLHDIGKPEACSKGRRHEQHAFTLPLFQNTMRSMGYSAGEQLLGETLMDNDVIGEFLMNRVSASAAAKKIAELAKKVHLTPVEYFNIQLAYYIADAGSYPFLQVGVFTRDAAGCLVPQANSFQDLRNAVAKQKE